MEALLDRIVLPAPLFAPCSCHELIYKLMSTVLHCAIPMLTQCSCGRTQLASIGSVAHLNANLTSPDKCRERHKGRYTGVVIDLWNKKHVIAHGNRQHMLAAAIIRRRLAAARKVLLIPVTWLEWHQIQDTDMRTSYMRAKLHNSGVRGIT
jgi:hypothetical protein